MKELKLKILFLILICVAMIGCRPRGVLTSKELRDLLYDLHRVDGAAQVAGYNYGHNQELASYYQSVLDKHGVTQAQFDSSLVWYTDHPQIFNKIYPRVVARLQVDMDSEEALRNERIAEKRSKQDTKTEELEAKQKIVLRSFDEVQKEYLYGIANPWKEWVSEEFCEKNVIIFGQMKKK